MLLVSISLVIFTLLIILWRWSKRKFDYWQRRNVPYIEPRPIFGNYASFILQRQYVGTAIDDICKRFPNKPYIGTFYGTDPAIVIKDPELLKLITTKDFYYFSSREISEYTEKEVFTKNLFFTYGDRWKVIRQNLTPLFSSSKMKIMFQLIEKYAKDFEILLKEESKSKVFIRSLMARYTMDCICSCAFGVEAHTMDKTVANNPFRTMGDLIFEVSNKRALKFVARAMWPGLFYGLGFHAFPPEVDGFFGKLLTEVFESRKYKPSSRNDFVDSVLTFKNNKEITGDKMSNSKNGANKKIHLEVDDELLIAQCVVFFAAGFETSATTLSFTLYELARHPEIQNKVIEEVDEYIQKHDGHVKYDCISDLPYLEACIDEALRLYPVVGLLTREVVEDYHLPDGLLLEKGLRVHIPVYHLHHNPEFFPDPEKFIPERFYGDGKKNVIPYTYMPFGEGPRICIGMRFAKMQMLAGLVTLFKTYRVKPAEDMVQKFEFEPKSLIIQPKQEIALRLEKRIKPN